MPAARNLADRGGPEIIRAAPAAAALFPLPPLLQRLSRRRAWLLRGPALGVLLSAAVALPLAGCRGGVPQRPMVLYVALAIPGEERITREAAATFQNRFQQLVQGFRRLHPNVVVQFSIYPEDQLVGHVRERSRSGLGPDLIVSTAEVANGLLRQGLTQPMPLAAENAEEIEPALLRRVTSPTGTIAALPLVLYTQIACFDRRRVPQPPATVRELLDLSAEGVRVGMALPLRDLFWSAGSLGAVPALQAASQGRVPDRAQREALLAWMRWLQSASIQRDVTFVESQSRLRDAFRRGRYDWISCSSSDLPALQRVLGTHLGVSTLPDGEGGEATPVNVLRVMSLGINSSRAQREMAIALSRYSLRPLVQRNFTVENQVFLPVNRHVSMPIASARILATLEAAGQQGDGAATLLARLHTADPSVVQIEQVIVPLVFGITDPEQALEMILGILSSRR